MKILRELDAIIIDSLYNQFMVYGHCYENYVDSPYVHTHIYKDKKYIYNILTDEILELELDEEIPIDYAIRKWYKFFKDLDPYTVATIAVKLTFARRRTYLSPTNTRNFIILTTTGCNARCAYCFEKGREIHTMSNDTALDVAKYLEKQYSGQAFGLCWFGGEPTLNIDPINIICDYLREKNIPFFSSIITNGSKLKDISIYTFMAKWNLNDLQITLDGLDENHIKTKNFIDKTSFADIKAGMDKFVGLKNVSVGLRMNISQDPKEFENKKELAEWLVDTYGNESNFTLNVSAIYDTSHTKLTLEDRNVIYKYIQEIHKILKKSPVYRQNSFLPSPTRDISSCVVQSRHGITIDTHGNLQICQSYTDPSTAIGNIYSGYKSLNILQDMGTQKIQDKCKICKQYPICQYLEICESSGDCNTLDNINLDMNIEEFIENLVEGKGL